MEVGHSGAGGLSSGPAGGLSSGPAGGLLSGLAGGRSSSGGVGPAVDAVPLGAAGVGPAVVTSSSGAVRPAVGAVSSTPVDVGLSCSAVAVHAHSSGPAAADSPSVSPGEDAQLAGAGPTRSWADIVASEHEGDVSHGSQRDSNAMPLPNLLLGGRIARPNTIVLHTQSFKDVNVREVMEALLKFTLPSHLPYAGVQTIFSWSRVHSS